MKGRFAAMLGAVVCAMIALLAASLFLPKQSLWIDETTQLGGIAAGPAKVVPFLTGRIDLPQVPFDRSPPLAYWMQQGWARIFGDSIVSLRWCGACCVALAAALVFLAGGRAFGLASGLAAGVIFALSPNIATLGVEIRAYPLFILVSAAAIWALVHERTAAPKFRNRWLMAVVGFGVLAGYVQYFGVILSAGLLFSLFVARWRAKEDLTAVVGAAVFMVVALSGLYPFILFAVRHSDHSAPAAGYAPATEIIRLAYRLIGHPAMAVGRYANIAAIGGAIALAAVAAIMARRSTALFALILTLVSGLLAVTVAIFIVHGFDAGAPHYNAWALPALSVVLSAGLTAHGRCKWIAVAGVALICAAEVLSTAQLFHHGEYFGHGPYSRIARMIERVGPEHVTLIVDGPDTHLAAGVYFPMHVFFGDRLKQFVVIPSDGTPRVRAILSQSDKIGQLVSSLPITPGECVMVVQTRDTSSKEISARVRSGVGESTPLMDNGPVARWISAQTEWKAADASNFLGFVSGRIDVFEKTPAR